MAVYTEVTAEDIATLLSGFDIGSLSSFKGIAEGVENSNFALTTDRGQYILTLYEKRVCASDLPFFLGLMHHLSVKGVICPTPVTDRRGEMLQSVAGRPAAIVTFLPGYSLKRPAAGHCGALGKALAGFHLAGLDFAPQRVNTLSLQGWSAVFASVKDAAPEFFPELKSQIYRELSALTEIWPKGLPAGIVHADLFPDNVFFLGDEVSGLIDFYFSCNDFLTYDLAICMNAWCFESDHAFNVTKAKALYKGYGTERKLTDAEISALPVLARGAALRFFLTRLHDWYHTPVNALVRRKDPMEYWRKLRFHQDVTTAGAYGF